MPDSVYNIPNGTKNLKVLFPALNWARMEEYFVEVLDEDNTQVAELPEMKVDACDEDRRIHFLNYLGGIDSLSLKLVDITHETKSDEHKKSPSTTRSTHAIGRNSIVANDFYQGIFSLDEEDIDYADELLDTPLAWMEWDGTQGQLADYLAIVILDVKSQKLKKEERYYYEITVSWKLSHEKRTLRA